MRVAIVALAFAALLPAQEKKPEPIPDSQKVAILKARLVLDAAQMAAQQAMQQMQEAQKTLTVAGKAACGDAPLAWRQDGEPMCTPPAK